ncbi:MAG: hypothetical protein ACW99U_19190 [Candidatus Thorarchaeota archaeon]|jgi:hypothetical protein
MSNSHSIRVFFSSKTLGDFKGRKGLEPVWTCHYCDKKLGVARSSERRDVLPPEVMPLVFSAELASQVLGVSLELVDINRLNMVQRMNERLNGKPVPRVCIGEDFITGSPTKDEIIELYRHVCNNLGESYTIG